MERAELVELLDLTDSPTTGEIRLARRQAARRLHPDRAGGVSEARMAEVNDACDRWIAEIRAARDAPTVTMPATFVRQPDDGIRSAPGGALARVYVLATLALMLVIMAVVVVVAGPSVTSIAVGALVGAAGGAIYLLILRAVTRR